MILVTNSHDFTFSKSNKQFLQVKVVKKQIYVHFLQKDGKQKIWKQFLLNKSAQNSKILVLNLTACEIQNADIQILINSDLMSLLELRLQWNKLTEIGISSLTNWQIMKNIQILILDDNPLGNQSCKYLSKTQMPNLTTLSLFRCNIGDSGVTHLSKLTCKQLFQVDLTHNVFTCLEFQTFINCNSLLLDHVFIQSTGVRSIEVQIVRMQQYLQQHNKLSKKIGKMYEDVWSFCWQIM